MLYGSRQELRSNVIESFSAQEEVYQVCIFGKEAKNKQDSYSDIDLVVYSNDPVKTWRSYRSIFESIAPIVGTFSLEAGQDWVAEMILLEGYSPYHKIDFSIGLGLDPALITMMTVYNGLQKGTLPRSTLPLIETRYNVSYHLANQLFSIPRFTKCLFRHDIDMYRRWNGMMNGVLVLQYEKQFGWKADTRKGKLMPYEIEPLLAALTGEQRQQLEGIFPPDGHLSLAESYRIGMNYIIALSREKATALDEDLNEGLISYMQTFLQTEIQCFLDGIVPHVEKSF